MDDTGTSQPSRYFLEACCTTPQAARRAADIGARRIELCSRLEVGGVTPPMETLSEVLRMSPLPVNVLVRPREGDFVYDETEILRMLESIRRCGEAGAGGVVVGALRRDGSVDRETMRRLIEEARRADLSVTFHRAIDVCEDPFRALEDIIALGCDRILTSGHAPDAYSGRETIGGLVRAASGRIVVMAGCGVRPGNIAAIAAASGAPEFHSSYLLEPYI